MLYTQQSGCPQNPAIVFLHGGGLSSKMWQPQMIIPNCGHVWNLQNPALFNQVMRAWVTSAALPAELIALQ